MTAWPTRLSRSPPSAAGDTPTFAYGRSESRGRAVSGGAGQTVSYELGYNPLNNAMGYSLAMAHGESLNAGAADAGGAAYGLGKCFHGTLLCAMCMSANFS